MAIASEADDDDQIEIPHKKILPLLYNNPLKKLTDKIIEKSGKEELQYVFDGIKLGCSILLWLLQGFLTPGAIMMLGLFVLNLSAFKTQFATDTFLGASVAFAIGNVFSNIYTRGKGKTFDQVKSDKQLIENTIAEIERYLLSRENLRALEQGLDTNAIIAGLEGTAEDELRLQYENRLYFSARAMYSTIYDSMKKADKYNTNGFLRFLTRVTLAVETTSQTLGFGFGMFIFAMMTINIFWTFPLWLIALVSAAGVVSGAVVFINALDKVNVFVNDKNAITELKDQLDLLEIKMESIAEVAPHVLQQKNEDFVDVVKPKKKARISKRSIEISSSESERASSMASVSSKSDSENSDVVRANVSDLYTIKKPNFAVNPKIYDPLFVNLKDIAERVTKDKNDFTDFVHESSPLDFAAGAA